MSSLTETTVTSYFIAAYQGENMRSYYNAFTRAEALDFLRRSCVGLREAAGKDRVAYDKLFWIGEVSPEATPRLSASGDYRSYCAIENIGITVNPVSVDNTYMCGPWRFVLGPL